MLNLKESPEANHVREMARYFNAALDEASDASTLTMDNDQAKGFISSYRIFDGLTVWVYNIAFTEDFVVELEMNEESPYYFSYNVRGNFLHRFDEEEFTNVLQSQNMIVIGGPEASTKIIFPKNIKLKIAVIIVDVKLLGNLNIRNAKRINLKIEEIFQEIPKERPFRYLGKIDVETEKYASIVCENNDVDLVGGLLTEGAVLNMLASQLSSFVGDGIITKQQSELSNYELSKVSTLGTYILDNLETKFTIQELSTTFGLSPKKMQVGVQHLYGDTIAHYVLNLRMGYARDLLQTNKFNVSQVCDQVGILSKSYFSKVFKDRYGLSPKTYLDTNAT